MVGVKGKTIKAKMEEIEGNDVCLKSNISYDAFRFFCFHRCLDLVEAFILYLSWCIFLVVDFRSTRCSPSPFRIADRYVLLFMRRCWLRSESADLFGLLAIGIVVITLYRWWRST